MRFIGENPRLILDKTWEHLVLSGTAIGAAILISLPVGIVLGHLHRGSFLAINVGNLGRALPSLALIAFGLPLFGIGFTNVAVALVVLAVPPMLTMRTSAWRRSTPTPSRPRAAWACPAHRSSGASSCRSRRR